MDNMYMDAVNSGECAIHCRAIKQNKNSSAAVKLRGCFYENGRLYDFYAGRGFLDCNGGLFNCGGGLFFCNGTNRHFAGHDIDGHKAILGSVSQCGGDVFQLEGLLDLPVVVEHGNELDFSSVEDTDEED